MADIYIPTTTRVVIKKLRFKIKGTPMILSINSFKNSHGVYSTPNTMCNVVKTQR